MVRRPRVGHSIYVRKYSAALKVSALSKDRLQLCNRGERGKLRGKVMDYCSERKNLANRRNWNPAATSTRTELPEERRFPGYIMLSGKFHLRWHGFWNKIVFLQNLQRYCATERFSTVWAVHWSFVKNLINKLNYGERSVLNENSIRTFTRVSY